MASFLKLVFASAKSLLPLLFYPILLPLSPLLLTYLHLCLSLSQHWFAAGKVSASTTLHTHYGIYGLCCCCYAEAAGKAVLPDL